MRSPELPVLIAASLGVQIVLASEAPKAARPLAPGEYQLHMTASEGSGRGRSVDGTVTFRVPDAADRSPRTGAQADDDPARSLLLYGWTDADLGVVGAPLCADEPHPSPASQDPVYPGLVVVPVPYGPDGPFTSMETVPTVLVATLSNLRDGSGWVDGCGFAMYLLDWDGQCHRGEWREWGLRKDGRGSFRLCPK